MLAHGHIYPSVRASSILLRFSCLSQLNNSHVTHAPSYLICVTSHGVSWVYNTTESLIHSLTMMDSPYFR